MKKIILTMMTVMMMVLTVGVKANANDMSQYNVDKLVAEIDLTAQAAIEEQNLPMRWLGSSYKDLGYGYYKVSIMFMVRGDIIVATRYYKGFDDTYASEAKIYVNTQEVTVDELKEMYPEIYK